MGYLDDFQPVCSASIERAEVLRNQRLAPALAPRVNVEHSKVARTLRRYPRREFEYKALARAARVSVPAARVAVSRLVAEGLAVVRRFRRQGRAGAFTRVRWAG